VVLSWFVLSAMVHRGQREPPTRESPAAQ